MMAGHVEDLAELAVPENPFPGLRPFEFNESLLYFGRDGQSEQLLKKLSATRFLAVVGTSGSGKSSLVRAGLLPALFGGFMTSAGSDWLIAIMRPGNDPIGNLARALAAPRVLGSDDGDPNLLAAMAESTLRRGSLGLVDLTQQARIGSDQNLLIVADQFEELFRFARVDGSEAYHNDAAAFVKLLLEGSRQREAPIYVVLTMRSDFLGDCSSFWGLPEAINEGQYLIPRLTRKQRREAITGPIAVCGGEIADRLVTRLLNDMGDDQDQLPILQHALMRTWGKWKEDGEGSTPIDLQHYESIGQMSDALSLHADEAFNSLPDERSRQLAEKAFKGLTEKGPDNREIRRPVTLGALCELAGTEESEMAPVIDAFRQEGRCFLMPPAEAPLTPEAMIDISHESLIRNWKRLKEWVDEEARSARIYRRLAETAALHREGKAGLERDPGLQIASTWREQARPNKEWAVRYHPEFVEATAFLDESLAARDAEGREKEAQRKRQAEAMEKENRRSRQVRNFRRTTAVLAAAFVICLGAVVYANHQRNEASHQRDEANRQKQEASVALEIAKAEKTRAEQEKDRADAQKVTADANADLAKKNELDASAQKARADQQALIAQQEAQAAGIAKKESLHLLYAADFNLAQRTHEENDVARADTLLTGLKGDFRGKDDSRGFEWHYLWSRYHTAERTIKGYRRTLTSVAFSPSDKSLLATASADGTLALVDSVTGRSEVLSTKTSSFWSSIFSPDGEILAALGDANTIELWDVARRRRLDPLQVDVGGHQIETIAFGKDGELAVGNEVGTITVLNVDTQSHSKQLAYPDPAEIPDVGALAFSQDGKTLASGYENGVLRVWDLASQESGEPEDHSRHGRITALALSSDDKLLAAATEQGWLTIWAFTRGINRECFGKLSEEGEPLFEKQIVRTAINCLAFSTDGEELATAGADSAIAFWQMKQLRATRSSVHDLEQRKQSASKNDPEQLKRLEEQIKTAKAGSRLDRGKDSIPVEHSGPVTCIAFSGDGHTFASGSSDRTVKVWRLGERNQTRGVISPDGRFVAASDVERLRVWDASRAEALRLSPVGRAGSEIADMVFSPDSKMLAVSHYRSAPMLYYLEKGQGLEIPAAQGAEKVTFRQGGKFLTLVTMSSSSRGRTRPAPASSVRVWDVEERRLVSETALAREHGSDSHQSIQPSLTITSPKGDKAASAQGQSITVSNRNTGRVIATNVKAHALPITSLASSPDGNTLASGSLDGTVRLWDARSLTTPLDEITVLRKPDGTLNGIRSLAFSPDGKRLALSDAVYTVLWDLSIRQQLLKLDGAELPDSLAFSADGMALGGCTFGRIWLGEPDNVTWVRDEGRPTSARPLTWANNRDGVPIPDNALTGGYDDSGALYICQLSYEGKLYVGYTSGGDCRIVQEDRRQLNFGIYKVLVNADAALWLPNWEGTAKQSMAAPPRLSVGKQDRKDVNICRARYPNGDYGRLLIGWTLGDTCQIQGGYGAETQAREFDVLHARP
jgi:WD40 repeat protein